MRAVPQRRGGAAGVAPVPPVQRYGRHVGAGGDRDDERLELVHEVVAGRLRDAGRERRVVRARLDAPVPAAEGARVGLAQERELRRRLLRWAAGAEAERVRVARGERRLDDDVESDAERELREGERGGGAVMFLVPPPRARGAPEGAGAVPRARRKRREDLRRRHRRRPLLGVLREPTSQGVAREDGRAVLWPLSPAAAQRPRPARGPAARRRAQAG